MTEKKCKRCRYYRKLDGTGGLCSNPDSCRVMYKVSENLSCEYYREPLGAYNEAFHWLRKETQ